MIDPSIGGGQAPGIRGSRPHRTTTRMVPMWVPWDNNNEGGWRLVPQDNGHNAQLVKVVDGVKVPEPVYQAKGFIPAHYADPKHLPALVEMASRAKLEANRQGLDTPDWAVVVLNNYSKVPSGADAA